MRQLPIHLFKFSILLTFLLTMNAISSAQSANSIEWSTDTISKATATGARNTYLNMIRGSGQPNATESIKLPVGKLKTIIDACSANNITEISVMVIALRQSDVALYRRMNPGTMAKDNEIKGSQLLVFRIPRSAFPNAAASKAAFPKNNPLLLSLAASGLFLMEARFAEMPPASEDLFFAMGAICPPPASCGD